MIEINLLPGAGRRSKRGGGGIQAGELLASASAWVGDKYLMTAIGAVVTAVALTGFLYVHQHRLASSLEERQIQAVKDSARYSAVLAAKLKAESTRDSLFAQLAIIKSIDDTRYLWSHLMQEISNALPPYTWLTAVTQTSMPPSPAAADTNQRTGGSANSEAEREKEKRAREKEKRARADSLLAEARTVKFKIVGNTVDIQALTRFIRALESSPFIQNVQLTRSDLVVNDGKEVTEFQLEAETQAPAPYLIKTVPLVVPAG